MKKVFVIFLLGLCIFNSALADFTVKGRFLYRDREYNSYGFTGITPLKPIRFAHVRVIDNISGEILGEGYTDSNGFFEILAITDSPRDILIECLSREKNGTRINYEVLNNSVSEALYALTSEIYTSHPYNVAIDFSENPLVAEPGNLGEVFNIFDEITNCFHYLESLTGGESTYLLTAYWESGGTTGSQYRNGSIFLQDLPEDGDGYDDDVIRHETGHFVAEYYSRDDSPGGVHYLTLPAELTLTWSEGWANFFNSAVKHYHGFLLPEWYVDTNGKDGVGNLRFSVEFETPSYSYMIGGSDYEVSVTAVLWDIIDGDDTTDDSPGFDDDALSIINGDEKIWSVFSTYMAAATGIATLEKFWDGWISPPLSIGLEAEFTSVLSMREIEYFFDNFESDGSSENASLFLFGDTYQHHTLYGNNDVDWIKFYAPEGDTVIIETFNLMNGANTILELYDSQGEIKLAENDDRTGGIEDLSSKITYYSSQQRDTLLIKSMGKGTDGVRYGSYDIIIKTLTFKPGDFKLVNHSNSELEFTVTNFGAYGFKGTPGNSEGSGFIYPAGSQNRLYMGALLLGNGQKYVSDAAGNGNDTRDYDFSPLRIHEPVMTQNNGIQTILTKFNDFYSPVPLNAEVAQKSIVKITGENNSFVLLDYRVKNNNSLPLDSLIVSLYFDWDILESFSSYENAAWFEDYNLAYQYTDKDTSAPWLGIALIYPEKAGGFRIIDPESSLRLTRKNKWSYMKSGFEITSASEQDIAQLVSAGPFKVESGDSVTVVFSLVGGKNFEELKNAVLAASYLWQEVNKPTKIAGKETAQSFKFELCQNYPNPFNSSTSIVYTINEDLKANPEIIIYNILGQKIREFNNLPKRKGKHTVIWDGKSDNGTEASSGLYMYVLTYDRISVSKKMLVLR